MGSEQETTILDKLDSVPLAQFDAFPKLPSSYKARSEGRGFMTLFVALLTFTLMLNDIGEYIWGWPDYEFSVDRENLSFMNINVDMVVNMQCKYLSVDLRDAIGDRLYLSGGVRRDGTLFDVGQATTLKEHSAMLSAQQAVAQSRKSRGFFSTLWNRRKEPAFKPTYNYQADGSACRIYGNLLVKKVTANLHITTLGHGYASYEHVDHTQMNLSHVITEFSFGPYFPDITQPLDYSFEVTDDPFIAYQYFLHVVPTTYIAPRSPSLHTHQYSVTHYTRVLEHNRGTPGIFFKFDLDPLSLTIHQRTTTLLQLIIRCVGVIGGVFVCMGYAIRITTRAVEVVSGADSTPGLVAAEASGAKVGLRAKWGGSELRSRPKSGRMVRQGSGWVMEGGPGSASIGGGGSPYNSYAGTPVSGAFPSPGVGSPYLASPSVGGMLSAPGTPNPGTGVGLGFPPTSGTFGPGSNGGGVPSSPMPGTAGFANAIRSPSGLGGPPRTPATGGFIQTAATQGSAFGSGMGAMEAPGTPAYGVFPPTPNPVNGGGFPTGPPPRRVSAPKKDD